LWQHAASLPFDVCLRNGELKAVLREIARRRIGEQVASGKKRGFTIPVEAWMGQRWHSRVEASFRDSLLVAGEWVQRKALDAELAQASAVGVASRRLWYLWVLEEWLRAERDGTTDAGPRQRELVAAR
jgi:hypothetical protein